MVHPKDTEKENLVHAVQCSEDWTPKHWKNKPNGQHRGADFSRQDAAIQLDGTTKRTTTLAREHSWFERGAKGFKIGI